MEACGKEEAESRCGKAASQVAENLLFHDRSWVLVGCMVQGVVVGVVLASATFTKGKLRKNWNMLLVLLSGPSANTSKKP